MVLYPLEVLKHIEERIRWLSALARGERDSFDDALRRLVPWIHGGIVIESSEQVTLHLSCNRELELREIGSITDSSKKLERHLMMSFPSKIAVMVSHFNSVGSCASPPS